MAYAPVDGLAAGGADVIVVSGPVSVKPTQPGVKVVGVESALEMAEKSRELFPQCDVAVMCAAVADYRPAAPSATKIKREGNEPPQLQLVENPDIARSLGEMKQDDQLLVGFALETDHENENARKKMQRKKLDMVVLNSLRDAGAGFGTDTNKVTILTRKDNVSHEFPLKSKAEVAGDIADLIELLYCNE